MNKAKIVLIVSFSLVAILVIAAAINYWYRPSETKPKSYRYVNNITAIDIATNQTEYIESVWDVALNFTTNDVFAVGSKINVNVIARPQDHYHHQGSSLSFSHAVNWETQYYQGHAVAADIPFVQDPIDPQKFSGSGIVKFIDEGPDCIIIKEQTVVHQDKLFCPNGFDPIITIASEDSRLQFENNKTTISLGLFIGAISSAAFGVITNHLLPTKSNSSSESTSKHKKNRSKHR